MNSILRPLGQVVINFKGGEKPQMEFVPDEVMERVSTRHLTELVTNLEEEISKVTQEIRELPGYYFGGTWFTRTRDFVVKCKKQILQSKRSEMAIKKNQALAILTRRKANPYKVRTLDEDTAIKIPMITQGIEYEVTKGDKMVEIEEFENKFGVTDFRVKHKCGSPVYNFGTLKNRDVIALYFSRKIGTINNKKFQPFMDMTDSHEENKVLPGILSMMKHRGIVYVRIRDEVVPVSELERREFSLRDRSKEEVSFLLNLKGDAIKVGDCSYYRTKEELEENPNLEKVVELKALGYNMLNYESNHVVVIARKPTIKHIESRCKKLHEEYYSFTNKEGEEVTGIYGLTKNEESFLKKNKKPKFGFDESEINELFDILKEIDGRQSQRNISHDIRNHYQGKYILRKTTNELFFLKTALEDAVYETNQLTDVIDESIIDEEVFESVDFDTYIKESEALIEKRLKKMSTKKVKALIDVVSGLHLRYEDEEDMGKYLSDELDEVDKVSHERESKHFKTHRNYYSQTEGVLAPNGNPQKTHKRRSNPPSPESLRKIRERNGVDVIVGRYAGVSDPEILSKIYSGAGVITPPSPTFAKVYPEYVIEELDFDLEDKDSLLQSLYHIRGYISEDEYFRAKEAILRYIGVEEKYPAPQFRVPTFKKEEEEPNYIEICNECPNEGACFIEKCKRIESKLDEQLLEKAGPTYARKLGFEYENNEILRETFEEIEGYIHRYDNERRLPGHKNIKVRLFKRKMERREEERRAKHPSTSSSSPSKLDEINFWLNVFDNDNAEEQIMQRYGFKDSKEETRQTDFEDEVITLENGLYKIRKNGYEFLAKGNIDALDLPSVSFAGIREPAEETIQFIQETVSDLSDEYVIISGLADGCDSIAHQACLDNNGITIAVLPCGFNKVGNKKLANDILRNDGLLISEYEPNTPVHKTKDSWSYHERNEIIAALSETVVICEAGGGTKNTFTHAKKMSKNILVQRIDTFNNNSFIELGARVYNREWVK